MLASLWLARSLSRRRRGGAGAGPRRPSRRDKTTWFFYTVKWGFQDEFLDLFQRNHYPILKAQRDAGVYTRVRTLVPEEPRRRPGRLDLRRRACRAAKPPAFDEAGACASCFPDQATFGRKSSGASSFSSPTGTCR